MTDALPEIPAGLAGISRFLAIGSSSRHAMAPAVRLALFAVFALAACAPAVSPTAALYEGRFEASCSPVDAPALLFSLQPVADGLPVELIVWDFDSTQRAVLSGRFGYGAVHPGGTEWVPARDGELILEEFVEGQSAAGWFWLDVDAMERVEGRFQAQWSDEGLAICG